MIHKKVVEDIAVLAGTLAAKVAEEAEKVAATPKELAGKITAAPKEVAGLEKTEDGKYAAPKQEEIDYIKEMITETGKVNIKYLMNMTDYSFAVVALSRALLEKDGFLGEPKIEKSKNGHLIYGFVNNPSVLKNMDIPRKSAELIEEHSRLFKAFELEEGLCRKILTIMRDKGTTNIDTISKILRADWNQVAIFRATLEGSIITEPTIANMLDLDEEEEEGK